MRNLIRPIVFVSGFGLACADAAVLEITTLADAFDNVSGCSLREAIHSANNNQNLRGCVATGSYGDDTILIPAGTITMLAMAFPRTAT